MEAETPLGLILCGTQEAWKFRQPEVADEPMFETDPTIMKTHMRDISYSARSVRDLAVPCRQQRKRIIRLMRYLKSTQ